VHNKIYNTLYPLLGISNFAAGTGLKLMEVAEYFICFPVFVIVVSYSSTKPGTSLNWKTFSTAEGIMAGA